jgi:hypothetical protein
VSGVERGWDWIHGQRYCVGCGVEELDGEGASSIRGMGMVMGRGLVLG